MKYLPDVKYSRINKNIKIEGWKITDFKVSTGSQDYETTFGDPSLTEPKSTYTKFEATIDVQRNSPTLFLKIMLGVYIAVAISMLALLMKSSSGDIYSGRMSVLVAMLFAAILNQQICNSVLG